MAGDWKFYVSNAITLLASSDTLRTKAGEITGKVWEAMKSSRLFRRKERQPEEQSVSSQDTFQTARDAAPSRTSRVFSVASSLQNFETAAKVTSDLYRCLERCTSLQNNKTIHACRRWRLGNGSIAMLLLLADLMRPARESMPRLHKGPLQGCHREIALKSRTRA